MANNVEGAQKAIEIELPLLLKHTKVEQVKTLIEGIAAKKALQSSTALVIVYDPPLQGAAKSLSGDDFVSVGYKEAGSKKRFIQLLT